MKRSAETSCVQAQTETALGVYARSLDAEEQDAFAALRAEIEGWFQVFDSAFHWSPAQRNQFRASFFNEQIVPRRITMLQITDRIAEINELGLNRTEEQLAESAENLRLSLYATFGVALLGGLALAVVATGLTLRLEEKLERQLSETLAARATWRLSRRGCCGRRRASGGRWRVSFTTKWVSRCRRF